MTTKEIILNYAVLKGGSFTRKDLLHDIADEVTGKNASALTLQINRLVTSGQLRRIGRGIYELSEKTLPEFVYQPSDFEKHIFTALKVEFPFLEICIWSPKILSSFMLHVPNISYTFVDVERDGLESVFNALQSANTGRNILFTPSRNDCERYLTGSDAIVVRLLVGQSPLTIVDGCVVPRIEKILVDAVGDNELMFTNGSELYNIYEYAKERNNINLSKLLRYASRRNRKDKVEHILNSITSDKSQE